MNSHTSSGASKKQSAIVGLTLFAAVMMLFGFGNAGAQGADDPAQVEAGQAVFEASCAGCHGADGAGSDRGRPLTDIASQQADRSVHVTSVTEGKGGMPSFADVLSAEEIDAAISYVRLTFVADEAAADDGGDDAAADEAAADEELAETGVESQLFAVAGVALLAAGGLMVSYSREARKS